MMATALTIFLLLFSRSVYGQETETAIETQEIEARDETVEKMKDPEEEDPLEGGWLTDPTMIERTPKLSDLNRIFPLWKSIAKGRALPRPWSLSMVTYWVSDDYDIESAAIQVDPLPTIDVDVSGTDAKIDAKSIGIKGGLWLFPFLNLHAGAGYTRTDSDIFLRGVPVSVTPPSPGPGPPSPPTVVRGERLLQLRFDGPYWNVGMTVAGGWNRWFGSLTMSYAKARLDASVGAIGTNDFTTERILPKFGYSFKGTSVWVGAAWIDEESHQVGSLDGFHYDVLITRADWTPIVGIHTLMGEHWELIVEGGFGDRVSAMFSLGYRF